MLRGKLSHQEDKNGGRRVPVRWRVGHHLDDARHPSLPHDGQIVMTMTPVMVLMVYFFAHYLHSAMGLFFTIVSTFSYTIQDTSLRI